LYETCFYFKYKHDYGAVFEFMFLKSVYPVWLRSVGGVSSPPPSSVGWRKLCRGYTIHAASLLPSLLPCRASYDVNIHERLPAKSALLGRTGYRIRFCAQALEVYTKGTANG
jgi:hypothetical protein